MPYQKVDEGVLTWVPDDQWQNVGEHVSGPGGMMGTGSAVTQNPVQAGAGEPNMPHGGWKSPMKMGGGSRRFDYPGGEAGRAQMRTGMQQLIERGMSMLREHAPEIADQAKAAIAKYKPQMEAAGAEWKAKGTAIHDYRSGARTEIREGLKAGKSAAEIKAGLADNITAFGTAYKPSDAAKFNERVTARAGRRVDRMSARYARRKARTQTGGY